jgi:hypothetical protein
MSGMRHANSCVRAVLALLLSAIGSWAVAQPWVDQGSIKSRQYKNEIRGASGVEATEFFTLEYSVSIQIEELGTDSDFLHCHNDCRGEVHKKHADCDRSCDDKCPEKEHKKVLQGEYFPDRAAMNEATRAANGLAVRGGGTVSPNDWSHRVSQALAQFKKEAKEKHTLNMPHITDPCMNRWWEVGYKVKAFKVRGTMTKVGFRMSRGVRTPINETVGTHEQQVATGRFAQKDPLDTEDYSTCKCMPKVEVEEKLRALLDFIDTLPLNPAEKLSLIWDLAGKGCIITDSTGKMLLDPNVTVEIVGEDMNTVKLVITNGTGEAIKVVLPPGLLFLPNDPLVQIMMNLMASEAMLAAGETRELLVSIAPADHHLPTAELSSRWGCLEMAKKEPNPKVKWKLARNRDSVLAQLAGITARSRFRGPHDQARLWIYTDKAPREEINKRMIPGVSPAMYAILLRDVAVRGGADLSQGDFRKLPTPDLLGSLNFDENATRWLVSFLAEHKSRDLLSFLGGKGSAIAEIAAKEGKDGAAYVGWVAGALLEEDSAQMQAAGVKLLLAVADAGRAEVAAQGGLSALRWLLISNRPEAIGLALDVLEAYSSDPAKQLAMASIEAMPNAELMARAVKVAGVTMPEPVEPPGGG